MTKTLVFSLYIGDYTTQIVGVGDYHKLIPGSLLKQPVEWKVGFFFSDSFGCLLVINVRKVATCTIHGFDKIEYALFCPLSLIREVEISLKRL